MGHFVSSPRDWEKKNRRHSRGDERKRQGRKRNRNESEETEETRASRWRAIAYPRASAIPYYPVHQSSECVPPVLIHRAINCDSFKVLAKKNLKGVGWQSEKGPKLYSTINNLRFGMHHDYVCTKWILDPSRLHPLVLSPGVISKFQMCSSGPLP